MGVRFLSIADDTVQTLGDAGLYSAYKIFERNAPNAVAFDMFTDQSGGAAAPTIYGNTGDVSTYSTVLAGTTGTDGKFNVAARDGKLYFENRLGVTAPIAVIRISQTAT
jgi:hypothetical protein